MLVVAVPMYVCSTGSIPIAAALLAKGLTPGAALVLLMAGPAVNLASILVIRKTMGSRFTVIYLASIIAGSVCFGLLLNSFDGMLHFSDAVTDHGHLHMATCRPEASAIQWISGILLAIILINALIMKLFKKKAPCHGEETADAVYHIGGMHCSHCKATVETAVRNVPGVTSAVVSLEQQTVSVTGHFNEDEIKTAVEQAGFDFIS